MFFDLFHVLNKSDNNNNKLLIAKLNAYGFINSSLTFIYSNLFERKQRAI